MPGIVLSVGDTEMNLTDHNLHPPGAYLFNRWGAKQVKQALQIKIKQGRGILEKRHFFLKKAGLGRPH